MREDDRVACRHRSGTIRVAKEAGASGRPLDSDDFTHVRRAMTIVPKIRSGSIDFVGGGSDGGKGVGRHESEITFWVVGFKLLVLRSGIAMGK